MPRPPWSSFLAIMAVVPTYALYSVLRRLNMNMASALYHSPQQQLHSVPHLLQALSTLPMPAAAASVSASASASTNTFQYIVSPYFRAKDVNKKRPTGEDAYFCSKLSDGVALGVADGVGGWRSLGVDACEFSGALSDAMAEFATKLPLLRSEFSFPPLVLLDAAYSAVVESGKIAAGGSTACVGIAYANGTLQAANLGDSGFAIFRHGKIHYLSRSQTHYFNAPYQLAIIPQQILQQNARFGGKNFDDKPSDANLSTHKLRHGDVVMFFTDGVLDNITPGQACSAVSDEMVGLGNWLKDRRSDEVVPSISQFVGAERVARRVVSAAYKASTDKKRDSPFAREAQRELRVAYKGGKPDDITVLVMFATEI